MTTKANNKSLGTLVSSLAQETETFAIKEYAC